MRPTTQEPAPPSRKGKSAVLRLQIHLPEEGFVARVGAERIANRIVEIDSSKLLLLENLNYTSIVALSVFAVYYPAKAFAVLRKDIPASNCERADNFGKFPGTWIDSF
jgi:hypothetical protein